MNTKLLKQKILDLAIRGKLTQQLKSDGTTADLLKEISSTCHSGAKRSGAIESKKSKNNGVILSEARSAKSKDPEQIIPLDKSDAPFEIPENWEWVKFGDVVLNRDSERKPVSKKDRNLHTQKIYDYYGAAGAIDKVEEYLFDEKLLLIGEDGANLLSRSKPNAFLADGKYWVNNHAHVIDAIDKSMLDYLAFYINAISLDDFVTGTAQPKLNQENLNKIPIPLPPLAEQQRIVAKIEEAFAEIDAIEKNKELLKTHIKQTRQKILDLAIHGKLVSQNKSDEPASVLLERITRDNPHYEKLTDFPFEIPDSWEWTRLGDVCRFIGGGTPDKSNPKYWNGSINWASVKDIKGTELTNTVDKITEAGFKDSAASYAEKEDLILVTRINPGMCVQTKIRTAINQDLKVIKVPSQINKVYVMVFCNYAQKWFLEKSSGTTVKGIKNDAVLQMPFPLPPLAEQKRIVDKIEEIFASLDEISLHLV